MKLSLRFLGATSVLVAAAATACSGSSSELGNERDAGDDGPSTHRPDGSNDDEADSGLDARGDDGDADADAGWKPGADTTLLADGDITIVGVTGEDRIIYERVTGQSTRALEAVALEDGKVTTILASLPTNAKVEVHGSAVGIWTDLDLLNVGMLSYWTSANGLKSNVSTTSLARILWSAPDGKTIAYPTNTRSDQGNVRDIEIVVVRTDTDQQTTLGGADRIPLDGRGCGHRLDFAGETFIAAYCAIGETTARLIVTNDSGTPVFRKLVDDGLAASWEADEKGTKILVTTNDKGEGSIITNDGTVPAPRATLEENMFNGFLLHDGSAAIYVTARNVLRRVALDVAGPLTPVDIVPDNVRKIVEVSHDQKKLLLQSLKEVQGPGGISYHDLQVVASEATNATPTVLVATASARAWMVAFSANGEHAFYFANGPTFRSVATDGSGERSIPIDFSGLAFTAARSGAIASKRERPFAGKTVVDLVLMDFAASGPVAQPLVTRTLEDSAVSGELAFGKKKTSHVVWVRAADEGPGLYRWASPPL